ncbi:MAG TPA: hypothetical protein VNT79_18020 [Phycisphaerae bacterium]|nr:hypothetical protein [Phycisphaerae bacterium]
MPIEFHCEHCNLLIRAPEAEAGQIGKCPRCAGRNYVPMPEAERAEIPLAPLDEADERRRASAAAEDAAIQMKLLREQTRDRDPTAKPAFKRVDAPGPGTGVPASGSSAAAGSGTSRKQLAGMIVSFIEAMSAGNLEKADKLTAQLGEDRRMVSAIIDDMLSEDLAAYGLPTLPKPVLLGFLKQLRGRL